MSHKIDLIDQLADGHFRGEQFQNKKVGLLDADIFGPSIPLMMNLNDSPLLDDNNFMIPLQNYGVKWYGRRVHNDRCLDPAFG